MGPARLRRDGLQTETELTDSEVITSTEADRVRAFGIGAVTDVYADAAVVTSATCEDNDRARDGMQRRVHSEAGVLVASILET